MYKISKLLSLARSKDFKEDDKTWKGTEDGKVCNAQPTRVCDDRNGIPAYGGYVAK
jgi:hypothetical protein